ncbi:LysR family transcriptional regulator [Rhodoplanes sp. Z2-YC6860]|uniref:LysR family transcriptional regulator n=1 Tax=Rhodoplanes sp. Z2-YC6860 TaxID=674703 RepID=UPI00078B3A8F|nr:LysR family transcriptional regulator [Rhodoplanes sp. Z2-YC6860]AMN42918.1 LysR family transcriptional regulator [Rhodoplanes sp. Z2-YC6860]
MRNVTLKQLRAFVMIAKEGSFTRAAARLNQSQSTLTLQIRELEAEVGLKLLHRTTRSVEPTSAGAGFLPLADRLLDELSNAVEDLHALARGERGSVAVVAGASVISLVVAPSIATLAMSFPGISVRILEDIGDAVVRRVAAGEADFGLASIAQPSNEMESWFLLRDQAGILCAKSHPLARKRKLTWKDLTRFPFASLAQGTSLRTTLEKHPEVAAALPKPSYEASSISALVAIVEQGAGFALLPSVAAIPATRQNLVFRAVHEPDMFRELHFVSSRRRTLTPAARQVASAILAQLDAVRRLRNAEISMAASELDSLRKALDPRKL